MIKYLKFLVRTCINNMKICSESKIDIGWKSVNIILMCLKRCSLGTSFPTVTLVDVKEKLLKFNYVHHFDCVYKVNF